MITKVKLKNWRSHLESEFKFTRGTNALVGILGSGKTSVLNGICFALFGTFPELQSKKLKLDDIIMKKPVEKNKAEVEVHFEVDGKAYSVKRIIEKRKGTTYSEFRENGKLIEAPNAQRVTRLVEKTLKVKYDLFSKAIYAEQNALDYFLRIPKGQRMKKIDELLMIDKFEKARAGAVTLANRFLERKLGKQSIIDQVDVRGLEKNLKELKDSLDELLKEKEELSKALEKISKEKEKCEVELNELKSIKENLEKLEKEEKGIMSAIEETLNFLKSLEEVVKEKGKEEVESKLREIKERLKNFEDELNEKQKSYEELNSLISRSKAELEFLRKDKIERLEKEIEEKLELEKEYKSLAKEKVEEKLEERRSAYEKLVGEIEGIKRKIRDLQEITERLSSAEKRCPLCESELSEEKKKALLEKKKKEIEELEKELEDARKKKELNEKEIEKLEGLAEKLKELVKEIAKLDELKKDLEESKKVFELLNEKTREAEKQFLELKRDMDELEKEIKSMREERQNLEILLVKFADYENKRRRLDELLLEKERLKKRIEEIRGKLAGRNLEEVEKKLKELIAKEKEVETKILSFDQLIQERKSRIEEYEKKLEEIAKEKTEIEKLEKLIKDLKIFEKALEQTQIELRSEFVDAVNYTMNKLWQTLYPYQDFVGIRLSIEEGDYLLQLQERSGRWVNVEGFASGGERSIACLALRVAFALVLAPQLRWLVLDEPTHNLDAKAVEDLAETLRTRINEFVDQVFLITHEEKLEDAVTGSLYRLERDKERDGVTKVIAVS